MTLTLLPREGSRLLLLGEGNFAFSASLVEATATGGSFGSHLVATSFDMEAEVVSRYGRAAVSRLASLREAGARLVFGVDASRLGTLLSLQRLLGNCKGPQCCGCESPSCGGFDRIVFNFPLLPAASNHARRCGVDLILAHRALLSAFLCGAAQLLRPGGLVLLASKDCYPYSWWRPESLSLWSGGKLALVTELSWEHTEYPSLYSGPCNVDRDASVKPTDGVIFVYSWAGSAEGPSEEQLRVAGRPSPRLLHCELCRVDGLTSPEDLLSHQGGKIHKRRTELEDRWSKLLQSVGLEAEGGDERRAGALATFAACDGCLLPEQIQIPEAEVDALHRSKRTKVADDNGGSVRQTTADAAE
ncbi:unnamed protein product [Polarella glacialis]|uniref:25S rRNA (uridine-N(3))-methyltransferase BMT5-like domain-containing protein n=1 Tax=Polarella glacialis TaxID=89957 RepID=A0A813LM66_POLGL|nr:unnamed protein product [Polarella glacialis]CAE8732171.1 unnamed protein product [Polarella glacialis]